MFQRMVAARAFGLLALLAGCARIPRHPTEDAPVETPPSPAHTIRTEAASAHGSLRPPAIDPASTAVLEKALSSKDYATRLIAVEAVGDSRSEALVGWLEHALGDPEHDVRMAAVESLDRVHSSRAVALLVTVRDDNREELDIRAVAAAALLRTTP